MQLLPCWKHDFSIIYFSCLVLQSCVKSEREREVCLQPLLLIFVLQAKNYTGNLKACEVTFFTTVISLPKNDWDE